MTWIIDTIRRQWLKGLCPPFSFSRNAHGSRAEDFGVLMTRSARFHLSRISKGGTLDADKVVAALSRAISIESRRFAWTVVDVGQDTTTYRSVSHRYISGKLVKYDPDALVEVVDEASRKTRLQAEPNMQQAASLFVYFPDESLFAHHHVWNEIRPKDFRMQIADIVRGYYNHFFVECELQAVTDLTRFLTKLSQMEEVTELKARVTPPNPLFGLYWEDLKTYLDQRRLRQMAIREVAKAGTTLPTFAPEIARRMEAGRAGKVKSAPIGDAAILMAADGYGVAEITGRRGTDIVVVKTSENAIQLKLDANVTPSELAAVVIREIARMKATRRQKHP